MSGELVIVSCAPGMQSGPSCPWVYKMLEQHAVKSKEKSVLLTDLDGIHSCLSGRWKTIIQFKPDGRRLKNSEPDTTPTWNPNGEDIELALVNAAKAAHERGFEVKWVVLRENAEGLLAKCVDATDLFIAPSNDVVVWLDTETTGLDSARCAVIEIAALKTDLSNTEILDVFDKRGAIPRWAVTDPVALEINGFNTGRWSDSVQHHVLYDSFMEWLPEKFILAGHNVEFDRRFICAFIDRYRMKEPGWSMNTRDTLPLARQLLKARGLVEKCSLETLVQYFQIKTGTLHCARADIEATREVYLKLCALK